MYTRLRQSAIIAGLGFGLAVTPAALAQTNPTPQQDKKADKTDKMDKMNMSTDDKAMAFDKLNDKQKMAALKASGHDMSTTPQADRMTAMSKLTNQEKADAYDKSMAAKNHKKM